MEILLTLGGVGLFLSFGYLMFWIALAEGRDSKRKSRNEKRQHQIKKTEQDIEKLATEFQLSNPTVEKFEALVKHAFREQEVDLHKYDVSTAPEPDPQSYDVTVDDVLIYRYMYPPISGGKA